MDLRRYVMDKIMVTLTVTLIVENCDANSGFQPIAAGGDGAVVQYCA